MTNLHNHEIKSPGFSHEPTPLFFCLVVNQISISGFLIFSICVKNAHKHQTVEAAEACICLPGEVYFKKKNLIHIPSQILWKLTWELIWLVATFLLKIATLLAIERTQWMLLVHQTAIKGWSLKEARTLVPSRDLWIRAEQNLKWTNSNRQASQACIFIYLCSLTEILPKKRNEKISACMMKSVSFLFPLYLKSCGDFLTPQITWSQA